MGKIVKPADFVGKYSISQNSFNTTDLQAFIDKYEKVYLRELLGLTLGDLLHADITPFNPPATARFQDIFNPIALEINNCDIISDGIKEILTCFIYWEFVKSQSVSNSVTGVVAAQNEVSSQVDFNKTEVYNIYNLGIDNYRAIQVYINNNSSTYPEFKGKMKVKNAWFI